MILDKQTAWRGLAASFAALRIAAPAMAGGLMDIKDRGEFTFGLEA